MQAQEAAKYVHNILKESQIGMEGHSCLQHPFFSGCPSDETVESYIRRNRSAEHTAKVDYLFNKFVSPFELRIMYKIIGKPNVELLFGNWSWMSMSDVEKRIDVYEKHGNKNVVDWAVAYVGMGHAKVVSMDRNTGKFFFRFDGGANAYEREDSMDCAMSIDPTKQQLHTFDKIVKLMREQ